MSNTISTDRLPQALPSPDEPLARQAARQPSGESWHRTFEHALGSSFDRWFQAPTERGEAMPDGARGASAPPPPSRPAASMFGAAGATASSPRASTAAATSRAPQDDDDAATAADDAAPAASAPDAAPMDASSATRALVSALGGLLADTAVVGVESPAQAVPTLAAPGAAAGAPASSAPDAADEAIAGEVADAREPAAAHEAGATGEREPLRVHAEWSDAGVRVWLGADAQGLAAVDAVTRQLQQWLGSQGTRLLGVVCNGQEVWSADRDAAAPMPTGPGAAPEFRPAAASDARAFPYQPTFL